MAKGDTIFNRETVFMAIRQSFLNYDKTDEVSKKRFYATKRINKVREQK